MTDDVSSLDRDPVSTCTSLAVVPYDDCAVSDFHRPERRFKFADFDVVIGQNWRELGVAAVVWDAATVMCEYLVKNTHIVSNKRTIELGAGTGLVGIVASLLGADVVITDRAMALNNIRTNVNLNSASRVDIRELTWGQDNAKFAEKFDVILGADIIYIEETFIDLLKTLDDLSNHSTAIYIACRVRYDRDSRFLDMLREKFNVKTLFYDRTRDVSILHVVKR